MAFILTDEMIEAYKNGVSARGIAKYMGVAHSTVTKALRDTGLIVRDRGEQNCIIGQEKRYILPDSLVEEYMNGATLEDISRKIGWAPSTCARAIQIQELPTRKKREAKSRADFKRRMSIIKQEIKPEEWQGFTYSEEDRVLGLAAWAETRLRIKKRDGGACIECYAREGLIIHHIVGRKKAPHLIWEDSNLVTLCRYCHSRHCRKEETVEAHYKEYVASLGIY